ncbi:hypothetical protein ROM51_00010 [Cronobacter sakazakii]|uniref:hypothetical protein n=1 Tax=Cronobacter sakazakii TaxID=28141 RepID=UPI002894778B|nr:hypothetical protein [Cronobacter sakazakii]MDT3636968.1 hypothetical protein [Cronobacter sakazakii]
MISSKERSDKMRAIISEQRVLVHRLCGSSVFLNEEAETLYLNLLDYVENDIDRILYTFPVLRAAIKTENPEDVLRVVQFFSSEYSNLLEVKYCYENENNQLVEIHEDEYKNYLRNNIEPVTVNGEEIEDFNPKYLSFYCLVNVG